MSGFIYRIEGEGDSAHPQIAELVRLGLFATVEPGFSAMRGKNGERMVCSGSAPPPDFAACGEFVPHSDGVAFAWDRSRPPVPHDLRRKVARWHALSVVLGDGQTWMVPVLKGVGQEIGLPLVMMHDHGGWGPRVRERYARTEALVRRAFAELMASAIPNLLADDYVPLSWSEQAALVSDSLSLVYRVAEPEVSALALLTEETMADAIRAIVDAERVADALKLCAEELAAVEELG